MDGVEQVQDAGRGVAVAEIGVRPADPDAGVRVLAAILANAWRVGVDVAGIAQRVCRFVPVDVCEVVDRVIEANQLLCARRGLEIVNDLPAWPVRVDGDPVALQEIVWNLLATAVRYTPAGGTIRVRVSNDGEHVEVAVADSGIGLEREEVRRIFKAFAQGAHGHPEGAGLGLTIAWELARAHGGTIRVRSAGRGRGSEFRLIVPAA